MRKPAFTPGSWIVQPHIEGISWLVGPKHVEEGIAPFTKGDLEGVYVVAIAKDIEANATLIAAAPTMFSLIEKKAADGDQDAIAFMEAFNVRT